jgi:uncharacterized protein YutE (UPF0331/DUF86 family)
MDIRMRTLHYSLRIERFTSAILASLIDIKGRHTETISFANKSTALSFFQKVNILLDIGALQKDDKRKFEKFMSIRNQFMHNYEADTYEKCVQLIDGCENYLFKTYKNELTEGNEFESKEEKLGFAIFLLCEDVDSITISLIEKVRNKHLKAGEAKGNEEMLNIVVDSIHMLADGLNNNAVSLRTEEKLGDQIRDLLIEIIEDKRPH